MAKVVQQDVFAATTNQVSTAEVSTAEEVAKTVDEAELANFMDEKRRSKARVAKLYKDKTLTNDDRVQRLADLINARSEEVELADLINARSEEVALNELIQLTKQAQSQKRKRNPTKAQRMSEMKAL
ncbi:hypothetical protein CTI12_AA350750 [Artemisia annua]|uniref:Uncharacterized protein n=1 Tax=Artemisia annua TaxID=35608 RepID=A0A2U1LQK9_ARTAN|nr:hypothetical protein CTI12_AA350750 [Artemisia annua]